VPQFPVGTTGKEERFPDSLRDNARVLTCGTEKVGRKFKIRPYSPSKVFDRLPEMDSFVVSSLSSSSSSSPSSVSLPSIFHYHFYFSTARLLPGNFLLAAIPMLLFTICKYNFVGFKLTTFAYTLAVNIRERCYRL